MSTTRPLTVLAAVAGVGALALYVVRKRRKAVAAPANTSISLFRVFMSPTVDEPLLRTLHSGYITQGPQVENFEADLSAFFGTKRVLTVRQNRNDHA